MRIARGMTQSRANAQVLPVFLTESVRILLARSMMPASWLYRMMLGQLALKLSREHLAASDVVRQSDAFCLVHERVRAELSKPARWTHLATVQRCAAYSSNEAVGHSGDLRTTAHGVTGRSSVGCPQTMERRARKHNCLCSLELER